MVMEAVRREPFSQGKFPYNAILTGISSKFDRRLGMPGSETAVFCCAAAFASLRAMWDFATRVAGIRFSANSVMKAPEIRPDPDPGRLLPDGKCVKSQACC
jgi:hypothetical protein